MNPQGNGMRILSLATLALSVAGCGGQSPPEPDTVSVPYRIVNGVSAGASQPTPAANGPDRAAKLAARGAPSWPARRATADEVRGHLAAIEEGRRKVEALQRLDRSERLQELDKLFAKISASHDATEKAALTHEVLNIGTHMSASDLSDVMTRLARPSTD
jgi:hypothetical protein